MSLAETAAVVDGAFSSIPIIDMTKCDTPQGRLDTAYEIRDACMRVGFFYIRNHGIPQTYLDDVLSAAQQFFSLPMATKMKLHHTAGANFEGYSAPLDAIDLSHNDQGDFSESFDVVWEEIEAKANDEKRANDGAMAGGNVWPRDDCPGFREACLEYYQAAMKVGKLLYSLFALALELPETYFDDKTRNCTTRMKVLHYPSRDEYPEINNDTPGVGAHTDFKVRAQLNRTSRFLLQNKLTQVLCLSKCFTILWQLPDVQGLQIRNLEQRWIDVPAIRDTFVINIGDQLAFWTNDVFKSTMHQVVNKNGMEWYSIPMFFGTDDHVNIKAIPSYMSADRLVKFTSINAGEYVKRQFTEAFPTV